MKRNAIQISRNLFEEAKVIADVEHRSTAKQIEHWAKLGKCAEEHPDLPLSLIKEMLLGMKQLEEGQGSEYEFDN